MTNGELIHPDSLQSWLTGFRRLLGFPSSGRVVIGYLILLIAAEQLVAENLPQLGLPLHGLILLALLFQSSLINKTHQRRFLLTLSLAPLIRLISLLMPLKLIPTIYWYVVVALPLFVTVFLISRIGGITRQMNGLVFSAFPLQVLVSLSGLVLGYVEYVILRPAPLISTFRWELIWLPALILLVFTGLLEELIFRGLMQSTALPYLGRYAILYVSVIFAVLHLGYRSILDFFFVFFVALFFGYIVKRSGSILGVTVAHGLINIMLFLIFPFLLVVPPSSQKLSSVGTSGSNMVITPTFTPTFLSNHTPFPSGIVATQVIPKVFSTSITPVPTSTVPSSLLQPIASITPNHPTATPQTTQPNLVQQILSSTCPEDFPSRLNPGMEAEVVVILNLRREPGMDKAILNASSPGSHLTIISGPVCIPSDTMMYRWWKVKLSDGVIGWSAEGAIASSTHFLLPVQ